MVSSKKTTGGGRGEGASPSLGPPLLSTSMYDPFKTACQAISEHLYNDYNYSACALYTTGSLGVSSLQVSKSSCPQVGGTELVYSGITGGTYYNQQGGGANYLCMPKDPEYSTTLTYRSGVTGYAYIHGSEYQVPVQGSHDHNVPCAVCT